MPDDPTTTTTGDDAVPSVACPTSLWHRFQLRRKVGHYLEFEDVHFNHDSAVLLADYRDTTATDDDASPDAQDDAEDARVTALAVLVAAFKHAAKFPARKIFLAGHTDRSGPDAYNLSLSLKRGKNVLHVLKGDADAWAKSSEAQHKVEDHQQLLKWMFEDFQWDTDPGPIDNKAGEKTTGATKRFQVAYNKEFGKAIPEDGVFGPKTWGAFFDIYRSELRELLGVDDAGLTARQKDLKFLDPAKEAVGCGENWPKTKEERSRVDRRVEVLFFDPSQVPAVPLACHPSDTQCLKDQCEIRNAVKYDLFPIPVEPVLPKRLRLPVHLRLVWIDPAGKDHPFPKDMEVTVAYGDGSTENLKLAEAGVLRFIADRRKKSFTLRVKHASRTFVATKPDAPEGDAPAGDAAADPPAADAPADADAEALVPESEVAQKVRDGRRVFLLPAAYDLDTADWQVDAAKAPTYAKPKFDALDTIPTLGTAAEPCRVALDPHWQYLKLLYFDRKLKVKLSLPPLVVEGFADKSASGGKPDTVSNWVTDPEACQCVPWILRKKADGSAVARPDGNVLLQVRTKARTFVDSSGADAAGAGRRIVTKAPGAPGTDPGLNVGADFATDVANPSAARLAFYDLPPVWKSRTYHARLSGGTGAPAAKMGRFESLAADPTSDAKPVLFSLDDIVLVGADMKPLSWKPGDANADRVALFAATFATGTDLSNEGLYKPDTAARRPWFTQKPSVETDRNYIADYPDWTRLVVAQGNLFDVFDRRVADDPNGVVGARAAVLWVDATHDGIGKAPGATLSPRPALQAGAAHPFYVAQPFYEQDYFDRGINARPGSGLFDEWNSPIAAGDASLSPIGRFDVALLRCCDADGDTEIACAVRYYRTTFRYTAKANDLDDAHVAAAQRTQRREEWAATYLTTCADRWSGNDGVNGDRAFVVEKGAAPKLKAQVVSFMQALDANESHFQVDLIAESQTSNMGSDDGMGELRVAAGRDTTGEAGSRHFAGAHETGHAGALPDEYPRSNEGEGQTGFGSNNIPGAPFDMDGNAMMVFNHRVRARYFWHVAEWMRTHPGLGGTDLQVVHGTETYELPHYQHQATRPTRNYTYWPVRARLRHAPAAPVLYDSYLYLLGADAYRTSVLPGLAGGGGDVDSLLMVIVKARFRFSGWIDTETHRRSALTRINQRAHAALNNRCFAAFTVAANPQSPPALARCLLHVSVRFRVGSAANEHLSVEIGAGSDADWEPGDDPRSLVIGVADALPGTAAGVSTQMGNVADAFFTRLCSLLGLSADAAPANSFTNADAYKGIVRSVAGTSVNPTMSRT